MGRTRSSTTAASRWSPLQVSWHRRWLWAKRCFRVDGLIVQQLFKKSARCFERRCASCTSMLEACVQQIFHARVGSLFLRCKESVQCYFSIFNFAWSVFEVFEDIVDLQAPWNRD